jgi:hypothetical protein
MDHFWKSSSLKWKTTEDKQSSIETLVKSTKALIHNILSVISITALIHGTTKIEPKHVQGALQYITRKCNTRILTHPPMQKGGQLGIPYVAGVDNSMYSAFNGGMESSDTINFDTQLARFGLMIHGSQANFMEGGGNGSRVKVSLKWIDESMKSIGEHYRLKMSRTAKAEIHHLIKYYLACLMHDLLKEEPVTSKKVHTLLKKKRYAVFH